MQLHGGLVGLWPMVPRSYLEDEAGESPESGYSLPEASSAKEPYHPCQGPIDGGFAEYNSAR